MKKSQNHNPRGSPSDPASAACSDRRLGSTKPADDHGDSLGCYYLSSLSVVFSSPELAAGSTYDVYLGGSATGTATGGLYQAGAYSPGTLYASLTVNQVVTTVGFNAR